jgi:ATP-dependent Lon protease
MLRAGGKIVPRILKSNNVNRTATATFSTQIAQRKLSISDPVAKQRVGSTARTNNHNINSINGASIFGGASSLTTSVVHKEKFDRLDRRFISNSKLNSEEEVLEAEEAEETIHTSGQYAGGKKPVSVPKKVAVLPLSDVPIYPNGIKVLSYDVMHLDALKKIKRDGTKVGLFLMTARDSPANPTALNQIRKVGVLAEIKDITLGEKYAQVMFMSHTRIKATSVVRHPNDTTMHVNIVPFEDDPVDSADETIKAYSFELIFTYNKIVDTLKREGAVMSRLLFIPDRETLFKEPANTSFIIPEVIASAMPHPSNADKLTEILESNNLKERLELALRFVKFKYELIHTDHEVSEKVKHQLSETNRKFQASERIKVIKGELGAKGDEKSKVIAKFKERLAKYTVPEHAMTVINDEMSKLSNLEQSSVEFHVTKNYLDWLTNIPWGVYSKESFDLMKAETVLDEDHYGLQHVKEKILQFIAVGAMKNSVQGKIILLVGPPGVGKTSIGKSIARSLAREFYRFSVGGMNDVAEIKGHRRTYVGAMPGKIIQALKRTQTSNPVILIDEIDKMTKHWRGDPSSALLEVLDPEQNMGFLDHYMDVPYDLSKVLFICTANLTDTIPGPLLDRMEVIRLSGYVLEEKMEILNKYLIPTTLKETGLKTEQVTVTPMAAQELIQSYCREAGVRNLQQKIEKIFRKVALQIVQGDTEHVVITKENLQKYVGKPAFSTDRFFEETPVGVVMGLAWTEMGGATLYVESSVDKFGSKSGLRRTGKMGEVMKESSEIAYTYAKAHLLRHSPANRFFETASMHMHIPAGATPKDGPSAGITMITSLLSLALNKPVKKDLAMTGEVTITGKVLPIGGVKEKTIAAKRSGVTTLIFPTNNKKDFEELPDYIKKDLEVHYVSHYDDVFKVAFQQSPPTQASTAVPPKTRRSAKQISI